MAASFPVRPLRPPVPPSPNLFRLSTTFRAPTCYDSVSRAYAHLLTGFHQMLSKLYIDHSVISHPEWWPNIREAVLSGEVRIALSLWNLFEVGAASDQAQREVRLAFLESLDPLWLVERRGIQRQEVRRFLWARCFGRAPEDLVVASPHLSVVDHFLSGRDARIGLTARQFIRELDYNFLDPLKKLSPHAQVTLKAASQALLKAKDREVFVSWLMASVPQTGPDGRLLAVAQRTELANFCYVNRDQFLNACPAMAVEDALTTDRTRDRTRKSTESDGLDGQHTVVALAYCDIFLTRDRYQGASAHKIRRMLKGLHLAEVCVGLEQFASVLTTRAVAA